MLCKVLKQMGKMGLLSLGAVAMMAGAVQAYVVGGAGTQSCWFCTPMETKFNIKGGGNKKVDEFLFATYAVTNGEAACLNPAAFNVANGLGGIQAVADSISNEGDLVEENGNFFITQVLPVSVDDFLEEPFCGEANQGACTPEELEIGGAALGAFWTLDQDEVCSNNWTLWGVLPTEFDITLTFKKNCTLDENGDPIEATCDAAKRVTVVQCKTDPPVELRNLIDDLEIIDPSVAPEPGQVIRVDYTCN